MPPTNRIVVDYGGKRTLVLLAKIHTQTGTEYPLKQLKSYADHGFEVARSYDGIKDINELKKLEEPNKEGFVIRFESGLRLKCKFSDYVRLHRILTQCTARTIWDLLRNHQSFDDLLEKVPDEFLSWVQTTRNNLLSQFTNIEQEAREVLAQIQNLPTRKEQAALICKSTYAPIVFSMLDGKNYTDIIWKRLKPEAEKPFKTEEEMQ